MLRRRIVIGILALLAWGGANLFAWIYLERRDLRIRAEGAGVPYELISRFEDRTATVTAGGHVRGTLSYRLFQPPELESGRLYPVILYLHGAGERGNDNMRQIRGIPRILTEPGIQAEFPSFVIAPQCPKGMQWSNRSAFDDEETCDGLTVALAAVDEVLAEYPADPDRVYVIGFSMGGFGAWKLAAREPKRFAAVVPIAGGGNPEWAPRLVNVPIRAVHGAADDVVPVEQSREIIAAIRAAGGSPRYDEFPGAPHSSWRTLFANPSKFLRWLHQQAR